MHTSHARRTTLPITTDSGELTHKQLTKLPQPTGRQIVPRPLPITWQPRGHPTLTDTPSQRRATRSHPVVTDINIRIEPENAGVDCLEHATQRVSLSRRGERRIDPVAFASYPRGSQARPRQAHHHQQNRPTVGSAPALHA
jgi:hypothetical protein